MDQAGEYLLPLGAYYVSTQLPLEDEGFRRLLRAAHVVVAVALLAAHAGLFASIRARMDRTVICYFPPKKDKHGKPVPEAQRDPSEAVVTSAVEHDLRAWRSGVLKHVASSAVVWALQAYFAACTPMVVMLLTAPYSFASSPLVQVHWVGKPAVGALERPFGAKAKTTLLGDLRRQLAQLEMPPDAKDR